MGEDLSLERYQALAEFRFQIRRYVRFSEDAVREAGLVPTQHQMLLAIKAAPDQVLTIGEIADRLIVQHHSAVELVARTEERGLVERQRGQRDRRQVFVHLTDEGEAALARLAASHHRELKSLAPDLIRSLQRIIADDLTGE